MTRRLNRFGEPIWPRIVLETGIVLLLLAFMACVLEGNFVTLLQKYLVEQKQ